MKHRRFETLDGMRGLCAILVAIYHFDLNLHTGICFRHAWLSVQIFFVLSGFVVSLAYEERLKSPRGFKSFMRTRALRLIPIEWMGTIFAAFGLAFLLALGEMPIVPGFKPYDFAGALAFSLLLIPTYWTPLRPYFIEWGLFPINPVLWSLQGEWFINIIYARFLYRASALLLAAIGILTAGILIWIIAQPIPLITSTSGLAKATMGFLFGVALFRLYKKTGLRKLPVISPWLVYLLWLVVAAIPTSDKPEAIQEIFAAVIGVFLIALLIRSERPMGPFWAKAGKLSYPLYACHMGVIIVWHPVFANVRAYSLWWVLPQLATAIIVAALIEQLSGTLTKRFRMAGNS
jgi:peptidoglycan/LPS O-acetylase OafA/YrhL